ncbi:MAG: hypothetical protein JWN36_2111 [Microbacteriaceae bacterium]|nr:hypothetical protein [Microbacteriaceae bacterium]
MSTHSIPARRPSVAVGAAILGGFLGLVAGSLIDLVVWVVSMASTLATGHGVTVPFMISTTTSVQVPDATAAFGWGMAVLPVVTLALGAFVAVRIAHRQRR